MMVKFDFKKLDEEKAYADSKAIPLVEFIMRHMDFLPYLCDCIVTYTQINCLSMKDEDDEDMFLEYVDSFEFEDANNYNYTSQFADAFKKAYDVCSDCEDEYQFYIENTIGERLDYNQFCQEQLGYVRGRVLEILLERFIEKRYKPSRTRLDNYSLKFETGCMIKLENKKLVLPKRKTVDIAGWDGSMGEFYEAKVNPDRFDEEVLSLLTLIKNELENAQIQAIVGCVSMKEKDAMIVCMDNIIEEKNIDYNTNVQIYGKNELVSLLFNRPNIIPAA